jgi:hypothetical protein
MVLVVVTKTHSGVCSMAKAMAELRRRMVLLSQSRHGLFPFRLLGWVHAV